MNCELVRADLDAYLDGELGEELAVGISGHLRECPVCRRDLAERRGVSLAVKRLPAPEAPAGFVENFRQARRAEPPLSFDCALGSHLAFERQ